VREIGLCSARDGRRVGLQFVGEERKELAPVIGRRGLEASQQLARNRDT
jgi:hypothetical protein